MNGQWNIVRQRDYRGGETQALLPEMVARNQLLRMENAIIFPNGYVTAFHQTDIQSIINSATGVCLELQTDGTYKYYATVTDDVVTYGDFDTLLNSPIDASAGTPEDVVGAVITGLHKAVVFLGKAYCPSVSGIINLTDFTFIAIAGKTIKKLTAYTNRLWATCTDGSLLISDNGDATTWNPSNILFLPNTDLIIDFIPVSGGAIVYAQTSIYAMYGSDYTDITFILLLDRQIFSSGAVNIDNVVYIVGPRGMYKAMLNGAAEIPHNQQDYFKTMFATFATPAYAVDVVQAAYLQRFECILFMWSTAFGGTQGFVYYPTSNGYSKVNQLLPEDFPYLMALNDANTDFIVGQSPGIFTKSSYPSNVTLSPRQSIIKTRHEDVESTRSKIWREFSIDVAQNVTGVKIDVFLDESATPVNVEDDATLVAGTNIFNLFLPRSRTISFQLTINNTTVMILTDDVSNILTDDDGNGLIFTSSPGNYTLKEMRVKYREAGPWV